MKYRTGLTFLCAMVLVVFGSVTVAADMTSKKLAAVTITENLTLEQHQIIESGNGRTMQQWKINGADLGSFEIIGDIQSDADLVGWSCSMYDDEGNRKSPVRDDSFCRKFFISVLSNVIANPEQVANDLLIKAKKAHPYSVDQIYGDISIETDTNFYFIRRLSRM